MNDNYHDQSASRESNTNFDSYYHLSQQQQQQQQRIPSNFQVTSTEHMMMHPEHFPLDPHIANAQLSPPPTRHNSNVQGNPHPLLLQTPINLHSPLSDSYPKTFTQDDFIILQNLLPTAETHKWKFVSNKVAKLRAKKMNSEFCSAKFHEFFKLPQSKPIKEANIQYINNDKSFYDSESQDNLEGILGTSLPYMVHPNLH